MPSSLPLARHYYETRREILAACGTAVTPWYRLTPEERSVAVAEAEIILEAVRRAHREQDIVTGRLFDVGAPREAQV
ncbi:hypothetical protein ACH4VR_19800 [Streptomyces sp. NPDC020883]|uniref:hypothetical protein n=1 Tax=Streptomyces sp. NPDC020883 TaxID=3365099 RepID=UPI0037BCC9B7